MYLNIDKLFTCLLRDLCIDNVSRDYLVRRLNAEGTKFLTVTLPGLWKTTLFSIERGFFDYKECTSFARKGKLPLVMNGLFRKIFDARGFLLAVPCENAFLAIRQVCEYWYKCAFTFSEEQLDAATESFLSVEADMKSSKDSISWDFVDECRKSFETYYPSLVKPRIEDVLNQYRPRFGPGSVHHQKEKFSKMSASELKMSDGSLVGTCRSDQKPFAGFFKAYPGSPEVVNPVDEWKLSKVLFVPKDARGPRVISKEPMFLLKMQMSFLDWSTEALEKETNFRINFADQSKNRELARQGSIDGKITTADLKEASDRIRYLVALALYGNSPIFHYFLTKVRSTHSVLKTKKSVKTVRLTKLSGMGSGLTFPILALTIHIAVCTMISKRHAIPYRDVMSMVYVYGDDLIVPTMYYHHVKPALEAVGLMLNANKSFSKGPFRESCGGDFLHGKEVSPIRLKLTNSDLPTIKTVDHYRLVVKPVSIELAAYKLQMICKVSKKWVVRTIHGKRCLQLLPVTNLHKKLVSYQLSAVKRQVVTLPKRGFRLDLSSDLSIVALERHARLCVARGLLEVSEFIYAYIEKVKGPLPKVGGSVSYLGRYSLNTHEIVTQKMPKVVFTTKASEDSIQEPCPYRYLGTKLSPEKRKAPSSKAQAFEFSSILHTFGHSGTITGNLDVLDSAPPGLVFGKYNERKTLCVVSKRDVEAWHLTNVRSV